MIIVPKFCYFFHSINHITYINIHLVINLMSLEYVSNRIIFIIGVVIIKSGRQCKATRE